MTGFQIFCYIHRGVWGHASQKIMYPEASKNYLQDIFKADILNILGID